MDDESSDTVQLPYFGGLITLYTDNSLHKCKNIGEFG